MIEEQSLGDYLDDLADKNGLPGGGSAAGVVAAMSTSLVHMVTDIQVGKKKFKEHSEELEELLQKAKFLRVDFEALVIEDAQAFEPVSKAYALPKKSSKEIEFRKKAINKALVGAAQTPKEMMGKIIQVLDLFQELANLNIKGSIVNDIAVGVLFARTALEVAYLNVKVNADLLSNKDIQEELTSRNQLLLDVGMKKADKLYQDSMYYLENKTWPNQD